MQLNVPCNAVLSLGLLAVALKFFKCKELSKVIEQLLEPARSPSTLQLPYCGLPALKAPAEIHICDGAKPVAD